MSFKEYWENHGKMYTQLGVSKEIAYKIWCDAADQVIKVYMENAIKNL